MKGNKNLNDGVIKKALTHQRGLLL